MARRRLQVEIVGDADKLSKAYREGADGADKFERETTASLKKAERSADQFDSKMGGLGDKAGGWGKDIAIGLAAGGGALAAGLFVKGFSDAMDKEAGQAKLGIQLGLPPEMAKAAGQLAGDVYTSGFGESLGEANEAVRFITQNMGGLGEVTKDEMKDMTKGVLTLADAFGEDLNDVTAAAGTLIKTGIAEDGMAALDLLTRGLSSPANKAGDLLDTFTEYSTQFRQLGLSGPQALGLMSQGLQAGARDADTVADALKEFAIRAQDGSKTTTDAFAAIGLSSWTMAGMIAQGGPAAQEALQLTIDKLNAVENPALRAQIATGLFGTKAEDLQGALGALNVTTATDQIGAVEGKMNDATAATDTNKAKVEEWRRSMETNVTNWIAETGIPGIQSLGVEIDKWAEKWDRAIGTNEDFARGLTILKDDVIDPIVGSFQRAAEGLGGFIDRVEEMVGWLDTARQKAESFTEGSPIHTVATSLRGLIPGFDDGGIVPGGKGSPRLILAHGGETVLPTHEMGLSGALTSALGERWVDYEDGSTGLQRMDGAGNWAGVPRSSDSGAYDMKAAMDFAALGWPAEDVRAIADLIARGGGAPMAQGAGTTIVIQGSVMGEQDFVQKLRSGNYQAARVGRSF